MARFNFRLQRVLDFRKTEEESLKATHLVRVAERIDIERQIQEFPARRDAAARSAATEIRDRLAIVGYIDRLNNEQSYLERARDVSLGEEEATRERWFEKRREVRSLELLRESAMEEWRTEEARREQGELDEWATMRRVA